MGQKKGHLKFNFGNLSIVTDEYGTAKMSFNPIWTGRFANLKRLGAMLPPPNLAISSQKTMKLGKGIL